VKILAWCTVVLFAAVVCPSGASGAGFALFEQGAKALGMAGAFTATADDPSALFFNPAGMTRMEGWRASLGPSIILPTLEFSGVAPYPGHGIEERWKAAAFTPLTAYLVRRISPRIAAGFGVNSPFGLVSEWEDPQLFTGRFISTRAAITSFDAGPALAVRVLPSLSVATGYGVFLSKIEMERHVAVTLADSTFDAATATLESDWAVSGGLRVGLLFEPTRRLSLGFTYRQGPEAAYEGEASFARIPTGDAGRDSLIAGGLPGKQPIESGIAYPDFISLGLAYQWSPALRTEIDVNWMGWSSFADLEMTFPETPEMSQIIPELYDDVVQIRLGGELALRSGLQVRAGYYFDQCPAPDMAVGPVLPDADRHGVALGLGRDFGRLRLDLYNLLVFFDERSTSVNRDGFNGTYREFAEIFGLSFGISF